MAEVVRIYYAASMVAELLRSMALGEGCGEGLGAMSGGTEVMKQRSGGQAERQSEITE